jgi:hypothetical protein
MTPDSLYSLSILGALLVAVAFKQFSFGIMHLLLNLTRPGATVVLLGSVALAFAKGLPKTALAAALLSMFLLRDIWVGFYGSDARRLNIHMGVDRARFDPANSVDLQFANKTTVHDSPNPLSGPQIEKMLVFPPSPELLQEMCG